MNLEASRSVAARAPVSGDSMSLRISRFVCVGATLGLAVGVVEAGLLFFIPRFSGLVRPDVNFVIWFLAPLVDMLSGAMLGFVFGAAGSAAGPEAPWALVSGAFGIGLGGACLGWLLDWFRIGAGVILPRRPGIIAPIESFLVVFIAVLLARLLFRRRTTAATRTYRGCVFRRLAKMNLTTLCAIVCGLSFYSIWRPYPGLARAQSGAADRNSAPNIILIVLDTVRADHLSCYGYRRPTTPSIDAIASRGTLFENAYAPTSWTLASLASIFTGLLPHQHGADWAMPLNAGPWTLARILRSEGYETVGFSSNPFYGLGAWRLSEGFDLYADDSYSVRHNLAATLVGQSVLQFLYSRLVRYNQFSQRDAEDLNQDVLRWYRHRDRGRPFFLFVNPMDAHRPYLPPPPYEHRFGAIPHLLLPGLIAPLNEGHPAKPWTPQERREMIDGYDNSLAYLDAQIGKLLGMVDSTRSSRRTVVIITSDHGEGFGEHGTYDHGWNLYSEVLHVPLILEGPGVPAGLRIRDVVTNRQLFSTVLDLARLRSRPVEQTSLTRFWSGEVHPDPGQDAVVAELAGGPAHQHEACLSLVSSHWHYIDAGNGKAEIYDLRTDPKEQKNLADDAGLQPTVSELQAGLKAQLAYSVMPWYDPAYLTPLNRAGASFLEEISRKRPDFPSSALPIGAAQDYFSHNPPVQGFRPNPAERDLLRSLPYH
jgi:arylsulfatase A-like enzyme